MQEQTTFTAPPRPAHRGSILPARLAAALVQAAALYGLSLGATTQGAWQAAHPQWFIPLLLMAVYVPLIVIVSLGHMPGRALFIWALACAVIIAGLGYHEATRGRMLEDAGAIAWPRFTLFLAIAAMLFTAQVLVVNGIAAHRLLAPYKRHFDMAWKLGTQLALAIAFTGLLWLMLILGAALFKLLGLHGFFETIGTVWFGYAATTVSLATALHLTDTRSGLIQSVHAIALALFSWLLPLLTGIVAAFLCSLLFTSPDPLWQTRVATPLLLATMAALVFLINCSYQDGSPEHSESRAKRLAATIGALLLLPLCFLAAWALSLRVTQYGWTVDRILGAAAIALAACYAVGYAIAVLRSATWLKHLEVVNVAATLLAIAMMLAIFSPVADPARLMVANQVQRLRAGAVAADQFDYMSLKTDGARWGMSALQELAEEQSGPDAEAIRGNAQRALASKSPYAAGEAPPTAPSDRPDAGHRSSSDAPPACCP
ncbi:hypothetical protein BOSP111201_13945 [Bordetella sputigena]|uniref:DUF4153 domain-containing protein n=1 Tax=Bordetella sputigena TaxID=1416810 RepID=UPI0039EE9E23